jgi:hypothetical protein
MDSTYSSFGSLSSLSLSVAEKVEEELLEKAESALQVSSNSESRRAAKASLPLVDNEDGSMDATNAHTSERDSTQDRVTQGRESSTEVCGTEGCYAMLGFAVGKGVRKLSHGEGRP